MLSLSQPLFFCPGCPSPYTDRSTCKKGYIPVHDFSFSPSLSLSLAHSHQSLILSLLFSNSLLLFSLSAGMALRKDEPKL